MLVCWHQIKERTSHRWGTDEHRFIKAKAITEDTEDTKDTENGNPIFSSAIFVLSAISAFAFLHVCVNQCPICGKTFLALRVNQKRNRIRPGTGLALGVLPAGVVRREFPAVGGFELHDVRPAGNVRLERRRRRIVDRRGPKRDEQL